MQKYFERMSRSLVGVPFLIFIMMARPSLAADKPEGASLLTSAGNLLSCKESYKMMDCDGLKSKLSADEQKFIKNCDEASTDGASEFAKACGDSLKEQWQSAKKFVKDTVSSQQATRTIETACESSVECKQAYGWCDSTTRADTPAKLEITKKLKLHEIDRQFGADKRYGVSIPKDLAATGPAQTIEGVADFLKSAYSASLKYLEEAGTKVSCYNTKGVVKMACDVAPEVLGGYVGVKVLFRGVGGLGVESQAKPGDFKKVSGAFVFPKQNATGYVLDGRRYNVNLDTRTGGYIVNRGHGGFDRMIEGTIKKGVSPFIVFEFNHSDTQRKLMAEAFAKMEYGTPSNCVGSVCRALKASGTMRIPPPFNKSPALFAAYLSVQRALGSRKIVSIHSFGGSFNPAAMINEEVAYALSRTPGLSKLPARVQDLMATTLLFGGAAAAGAAAIQVVVKDPDGTEKLETIEVKPTLEDLTQACEMNKQAALTGPPEKGTREKAPPARK